MAHARLTALYQTYAKEGYDSLLRIAQKHLASVTPHLVRIAGKEGAHTFLTYLFASMIGVDGRLTDEEYTFIRALLGDALQKEKMIDIAGKVSTPAYMATLDDIIDRFPPDINHEVLRLCLCFMAVDHSIDSREAAFFEKLLKA